MAPLLAEVMPLSVASAMSPVILGISITLLSRKATRAVLAFLLGSALAALVLLAIGAGFASGDDAVAKGISQPVAVFDVALGFLLAAFGVKVLIGKEGAGARLKAGTRVSAGRLAAIGFMATITNFDAALLNITAVRLIAGAPDYLATKLLALGISEFFLLSPILAPLLLYTAYPQKSARILAPVGAWMSRYGKYVVGIIFLGFGAYLIMKGL